MRAFSTAVYMVATFLLLIGCGAAPRSERMPIPERPPSASQSASPNTPSATSLPPSANIDLSGLRLVEVVFRTQLNVNQLDDLYATTRDSVDNIAVISRCDTDVLKAFIVKSWSPVVLMHLGGRQPWALVGYDDARQEILLENPISRIVRPLQYKEFERAWSTGSGDKCVLITPGKLTQARVHAVLAEYLPPQRAMRVTVRSR